MGSRRRRRARAAGRPLRTRALAATVAAVCAGVAAATAPAAPAARTTTTPAPATTTTTPPPATTTPPATTPAPLPQAVVTVRDQVKSRPIARSFVGLSLEYRAILEYLGTNPRAIDPVFVQLLQNLNPGQPPSVRIGGDSTDWTWWPVRGMKRPRGVTYDITPNWLTVARALAQTSGSRYILGINLEAGSGRIESAEAHALLNGIGRSHIEALELGNEPELYSKLGWYRSGSRFVPGRPPNYDFQGFAGEVSTFGRVDSPVLIAGPSTGSFWWLRNLQQFIATERSLGLVTVHSYWLNSCLTHRYLPGYPSVPHLLSPSPPSRLALTLSHYAALAHARNIPIRIDEMNSVTCGGQNGVSNVFASALWAMNALFQAAAAGIDGVNIHTFPGTANQLFGFTQTRGQWAATVRPEYYGLQMFTQAAPPGSQLLTLIQQNTGAIRDWATAGADGVTRVLLINDSLTQARSVLVRVAAPSGPAQIGRLLAPNAMATGGITLDGQTYGVATTTGVPAGHSVLAGITAPTKSGVMNGYVVAVPAASAALLSIEP